MDFCQPFQDLIYSIYVVQLKSLHCLIDPVYQVKRSIKLYCISLFFLVFFLLYHPNPLDAAKFVKKIGADSITIHLREDRRHINDYDAKKICSVKGLTVNLEISTNKEIVKKALNIKPNYICIVPENRKEITTEGGLDLIKNKKIIKEIILKFKKKKLEQAYLLTQVLMMLNIKGIIH